MDTWPLRAYWEPLIGMDVERPVTEATAARDVVVCALTALLPDW